MNTVPTLNTIETLVWCRTARRERAMLTHVAEHAVASGLVDLAGVGSLPIDRTLRPGDRTLGDGQGCAHVRTAFAPDAVTRLRLPVAQRMVAARQAHYVHPDGTPIVLPVAAPVLEPALVSQEPAPPTMAHAQAVKPSLLQRAARFAETIF